MLSPDAVEQPQNQPEPTTGQAVDFVQMLKNGIPAWNQWRIDNPDTVPEMAGADLHGLALHQANLRYANLSGANLERVLADKADMCHANLQGANLISFSSSKGKFASADLTGATLSNAYLEACNLNAALFCGANLSNVSMKESTCWETDFTDAILFKADFRKAFLLDPKFANADITEVWFGWLADRSKVDLSKAKGTPTWEPMNANKDDDHPH
jgi:uncharacterized protein YjbI with pentapeptide repeats